MAFIQRLKMQPEPNLWEVHLQPALAIHVMEVLPGLCTAIKKEVFKK
jgi:hypothetical protein